MRILFFIKTLNNSGGTERITTLLANYLSALKHDVTILSWVGGEKRFFELDRGVRHISLFELDEINIYKCYFETLKRYFKLKRELKPQIVIDVCVAMSIVSLPVNIFVRSKIISWEHFNTTVSWNVFTSNLSRWLVSKFSDSVIVLTNIDKVHYIQKFNPRKIDCIPNPITINNTGAVCDIDKKYVLSIGRLTEQKGYDLLLVAWEKVIAVKSDWKLQIIGDGLLYEDLLNQAISLKVDKYVEFIEPTKNIDYYYLNSSIYVMSSRYEGMPLVLLESKSFGLPIISFDCPTGPREIVRDGVDGILVEPNDILGMADSLLKLMNDDEMRRKYSRESRLDSENYSFESFGNKWIKIINC